jgi:hypothetical protein
MLEPRVGNSVGRSQTEAEARLAVCGDGGGAVVNA